MSRQRTAQRPPRAGLKLARFPERVLPAGRALWRFTRPGYPTPWHFAALPATSTDQEGRFDLPHPKGTCYLTLNPVSAVMECIGPEWADGGVVSSQLLARRRLYRHELRAPLHLANLTSEKVAGFSVTRELAAMADYEVPQAWAHALAGAGRDPVAGSSGRFDGIIYPPRFHVSSVARSVALFGPGSLEVDAELQVDDALVGKLAAIGVTVLDVPPANAMG